MKTKSFLVLTLLVALVTFFSASAYAIHPDCVIGQPGIEDLEDQIACAIEKGLEYISGTQPGSGGWFDGYTTLAATGLMCVKYIDRAKELGKDPFDTIEYEYADELVLAINHIASKIIAGDLGELRTNPTSSTYRTYTTGIADMCFSAAASVEPNRTATTGAGVKTYTEIVQGLTNWLTGNQQTSGCDRGGWYYQEKEVDSNWADNSISGYATMGLGFAQSLAGVPIPQANLENLDAFIDIIQQSGGPYDGGSVYGGDWFGSPPDSCYMSPVRDWINALKTGNLLYELCLVGDGQDSSRVDRALTFLEKYWDIPGGTVNGSGWKYDYQAMFTLMKGLEGCGVDYLDLDGGGDRDDDWFAELAQWIVDDQEANGSFLNGYGNVNIETAWALLTLERAVPPVFVSGIGEIKEGTPFRPDPTGNGRAVAYDGTNVLYYTLYPYWNIYRATTAGASLGAIPLGGRNFTCGSLSWDPIAGQLWCGSYDGSSNVYTINPATGVATLQFNTNAVVPGGMIPDSCYWPGAEPFLDGLAFDPSDGTVWLSGDAARTVYHIDPLVPALLGSFTVPDHPNTGVTGCNTGIEVAPGGFLELAMQTGPDQGPHVIAKIEKADDVDNPPIVVSFVALATNNPGIEDVAYDPDTFAPRCALWTNQFGGPAPGGGGYLTAFDVQCTRTIGYWKTHAEDANPFLPIKLGDNDQNGVCWPIEDADDVEEVLKAARAKDAADMLYAQLLAAKLNVAMKDITLADFLAITPVISDADDLLGRNDCNPDTGKKGADRAEATALIDELDAFNNMYSP